MISLLSFILTLVILVGFHEWGHYFAARRCGVHIERFSIGFGKPFFSWKDRHGTEFALAPIPLGGYVRMLDGRINTLSDDQKRYAFDHQSVLKRVIIVAAGPIANFVLAILVYSAVFMQGVPNYAIVVTDIVPDSVISSSKITTGAELKSIAGIKIVSLADVQYAFLQNSHKKTIEIDYTLPKSTKTTHDVIELKNGALNLNSTDLAASMGLILSGPRIESVVDRVVKASPAEKAGLKRRDDIIAFNGQKMDDWAVFSTAIKDKPNQLMVLTILRQQQPLTLNLRIGEKQNSDGGVEGFAGIVPKTNVMIHQYSFLPAIKQGIDETGKMIRMTLTSFWLLITGALDFSHLSGPVSIAKVAGASAQYGFSAFLQFLGFISITLGVVNLFPFPLLDGGQLLFLFIEKIKGRPLSENVQGFFNRIGLVILLTLMGLALFNDIYRF